MGVELLPGVFERFFGDDSTAGGGRLALDVVEDLRGVFEDGAGVEVVEVPGAAARGFGPGEGGGVRLRKAGGLLAVEAGEGIAEEDRARGSVEELAGGVALAKTGAACR